jgi:glycosyltransferase involved in cell wall biosynthesis
VLIPASGLFAQFYRYVTETSSSQRRQTRLVVIALGVMAAVPSLLIVVTPELGEGLPGLALVTPRVEALYELILLLLLALALLTLPLSIAVSVLRYRLWDIDLLVNRALVYGSLTATLGAAYVATVVLLQQVFSPVTQRSTIAVAISTLAFAALFQPARDRFQAIIDRRFNRRKYNAEQTIVAFSSRLREEVNLDSLADDLLNVVDETMEPSHVSLWLRPTTEAAEA